MLLPRLARALHFAAVVADRGVARGAALTAKAQALPYPPSTPLLLHRADPHLSRRLQCTLRATAAASGVLCAVGDALGRMCRAQLAAAGDVLLRSHSLNSVLEALAGMEEWGSPLGVLAPTTRVLPFLPAPPVDVEGAAVFAARVAAARGVWREGTPPSYTPPHPPSARDSQGAEGGVPVPLFGLRQGVGPLRGRGFVQVGVCVGDLVTLRDWYEARLEKATRSPAQAK